MGFFRPNADDIDGNWTNEAGATTLYSSIDESSASDTDYIKSPVDPVSETCRVALADATGASQPFIVRYRFNNDGTELLVRLVQGASTEIAAWMETAAGWNTVEHELSGPQFALITDANDLFIEFTAGPTPALDLDFTTGTLDPKVTFTRTTAATVIDATGKVTIAAHNAVSISDDFTHTYWVRENLSVTVSVADPDGGTAAQTLTVTGGSSYADRRMYIAAPLTGGPASSSGVVYSIWMRRRTGTAAIYFYDNTDYVNVSSQVSTTWARVYLKAVPTYFIIALAGGAGEAVDIWHAQAEYVTYETSPRTFIANTSGGVIYGPRFDHDPVTLAARGLLIEEQRTNLCAHSDNFADAAWGVVGVTKVGVAGVSDPAGGSNAYEVTFGTYLYHAAALLAGTTYTVTCWVRAKTGSTNVRLVAFDDSTIWGPSPDKVATSTAWTRIEFIFNVVARFGAASVAFQAASGGTTNLYVYGYQCEAGAFATSYIPTTSAAVTRAADSATMTGANFSSWWNGSAGTFVAEFDSPASGTRPIVTVDDNTANEAARLYSSGTDPKAIVIDGGATQTDLDAGTLTANTSGKLGLSFAANDFAACFNGGTVAVDTGGTLPTVTQARLGADVAGNYLTGHLAALQFYNVAKSDAELQALTT